MIKQLFETKDDHMKTSNICVTLESSRQRQGKGQPRKQKHAFAKEQ